MKLLATVAAAIALTICVPQNLFAQGGVSIDALEKLSEGQLEDCRLVREHGDAIKTAIAESITAMKVTMSDGKSPVAVVRFTLCADESKFRTLSCCQCCVNGNYCCGPCDDNCCNYSIALQDGEPKVACCGGDDTVSLEMLERIDKSHLNDCRSLSKQRDAIADAINKKLASAGVKTSDGKPLFIRGFTVCLNPASAKAQLALTSCCQCCTNGNYCCGPCDDNCCNYN